MTIFEFIIVTVAIVYGLGLTELLGGVVRVLRGELRADPLHSVWVLSVFLFLVQGAWSLWGYSQLTSWTYLDFLLVLWVPLALYLAAAVLFPSSGQTTDLGEHFFLRRRSLLLVLTMYLLGTALTSALVTGNATLGQQLFRLGVLGAYAVLALTEDRRVHWPIILVLVGTQLWWTYTVTPVVR